MTVTLHEIARAIRGKVTGGQVLAPGPNHSCRDASLSVRLSDASPDGFIVFSHAGDDWTVCRDYVADALGLDRDRWRRDRDRDREVSAERQAERQAARAAADEEEQAATTRRRRFAREIWHVAQHPQGTLVEVYLRSRCLDLPDEVAGDVIRFHPRCAWRDEPDAPTIYVPAMVCAMRDIATGDIVAVHRTRLDEEGRKVARKMLGTAAGAAIMLDAMADITIGLTIGEGVETCMAARQLGIRPTWALGSVGAISAFPVLAGVEALTVLGERDRTGASARASRAVGERWHQARRSIDIITPKVGQDMNDVVMGEAAWA